MLVSSGHLHFLRKACKMIADEFAILFHLPVILIFFSLSLPFPPTVFFLFACHLDQQMKLVGTVIYVALSLFVFVLRVVTDVQFAALMLICY